MLVNRRFKIAFCLALAAALGATRPASACFEIDNVPAPYIWFTSTTTANVAIWGAEVKTGGLAITDNCAAGLGHSGAVLTGVTGLTVVDDPDPTAGPIPITGFAFSTNATTSTDLTTAAPGVTWEGFSSAISAPVAGNTPVALVFAVTVTAGTTYQQIIDDLQTTALLGLDDANGSGNLLGTSQNIDPIVGVTELPECTDDVVQPGEVCDTASDMNCSPGDRCIDCSVCVLVGQAETCKSRIIRDITNNLKRQLKCYAKAAKQGLTVDPNCLAGIYGLSVFWPKYTLSCPQTFPPDSTMQSIVDAVGSNLQSIITPLGVVGPETKCAANKFKAASFRAVAKIKCHSKALAQAGTVDPACITAAETKYTAKYTSAENLGCAVGNTANSPSIEGTIDTYVNTDVVGNILP